MIHIVGAGCGAVDLITVRGKKLLEEADVIIYAGSLINKDLLTFAKPGAELHDSAEMTLEDVMEVIKNAEAMEKNTVRLHTGDPSLYGAIKEQMVEFDHLGFKYDITPGVSAFSGAAAALKAEYTLPDVSQTVIITRVAGRTGVPDSEQLRELAKHNSTIILYLSTGLLDKVSEELIAGGYSPDSPAAIVYKASWPDEKVFRCTVGTLAETAKTNNITKLALITVGGFLGDDFERSKLYDPTFTTEFRKASE